MKKNELESIMKLHGDTGTSLAEYLELSRSSFSNKLNENTQEFTLTEIKQIKEKYNLTPEQIDRIFFAVEVS